MAAINANIVVDQTNVILNPTTNSIGVTVDPINLGIYTGGIANVVPGGTPGQLQYNFTNTEFGGVANTSVASNGTVTFQNLANLKVNGGTNGYFLQTDGAGTLTWNAGTTTPGSANPGGANTQIQYNDAGSFGGQAGFTFDETTGNVAMPENLTVAANIYGAIFNGNGSALVGVVNAGTVTSAAQANITSVGTLSGLAVNGTVTAQSFTSNTTAGFTGDGGGLSNIAAANVTGLSLSQIANGTSNVDIASVDGNVDFTVGGANVGRMSTTGAAAPGVLAVNGNITAINDIETSGGNIVADTGNIVATAGQFVGDGGGLSNLAISLSGDGYQLANLTGANVTGSVSNADSANLLNLNSDNEVVITGNTYLGFPNGEGIAIGHNAAADSLSGQGRTAIAIGVEAGFIAQQANAVALGTGAGHSTQGANATALGYSAGRVTQGSNAVSVGSLAGQTNQGSKAIAIGDLSGYSQQSDDAISIGANAGQTSQGIQSIAIGSSSGLVSQGGNSIAVGHGAGQTDQLTHGVAVGYFAGRLDQSANTVAIGYNAGENTQGGNSIAIGKEAGKTSQAANSIILNASGATLDSTQTGSFNVKPVRSILGGGLPTGFKQVAYNPTTGEFIYYD